MQKKLRKLSRGTFQSRSGSAVQRGGGGGGGGGRGKGRMSAFGSSKVKDEVGLLLDEVRAERQSGSLRFKSGVMVQEGSDIL